MRNESLVSWVELTRFGGHLTLWDERGGQDGTRSRMREFRTSGSVGGAAG